MTYPILRRNSIASHEPADLSAIRTSPSVGSSSRFTSLRVVVLPEPLRPSNTRVSPPATLRFRPDTRGVPEGKRNPTPRKSKAYPFWNPSLSEATRYRLPEVRPTPADR